MDDALEQPRSSVSAQDPALREDVDGESSGDEDGGLDWSKIPRGHGSHRPVIPKRGEKDFEPTEGSNLQTYQLDRARTAMFDVLRTTRSVSSKSMSYAVWQPAIARARVTTYRGIDFTHIGHSVARPSPENPSKTHKHTELLPEEALYLIEKGSLLCWKAVEGFEPKDAQAEDNVLGAPMSVQEAFTTMIGTENLTLERYQVYSYLRRLGFVVTRAKPPSAAYPVPAPYPVGSHIGLGQPSFFRRLISAIIYPFKHAFDALFLPTFNWWRPIVHRRWLCHNMDYASVYKSLRLIPNGHSAPLHIPLPSPESPYEIFYHLYKPPTPFKKTAPPPPDFEVVVVNARTTPFPSLSQLDRLFSSQPILPPPLPRQRKLPPKPETSQNSTSGPKISKSESQMSASASQKPAPVPQRPAPVAAATSPHPTSMLSRLVSVFTRRRSEAPSPTVPTRRVNPFMALRQGHRMVIIAAVDGGVASIFRLGQGAFEEWPMA